MAAKRRLADAPQFDEVAELIKMAGNPSRLKMMYMLDQFHEVCVSDLSDVLDLSVSAVSQHLARLRSHGLVQPRRDAQTIYYRLGKHGFVDTLRRTYFRRWARR